MGKSKGKKSQPGNIPPKQTQAQAPAEEAAPSAPNVPIETSINKLTISSPASPKVLVEAPAAKITSDCPICKTPAVSKCGGCNKVGYCSREHQKQHWKLHKNECTAWKISQSPELGRYLAATRDIKPGSIILQEKPLLLTPPRITAPVCLGCYNEFLPPDDQSGDQDIQPVSCPSGCGWPMCNTEACKANRDEHKAECSISLARGGVNIRNFGQDHPMYQAVGILRALHLKDTAPASYQELLALQSHAREQHEAQQAQQQEGLSPQPDLAMVTNLICKFFSQEKNNVNEDLVKELTGIIETNGHEIPLPGNYGQINRRLVGVYNASSLLEHNCRPNCVKSWDSKTKEIVIRSSIPIKKGEHLSISYVDPLWGTNDRQNFLQMTKFFTCKCERCKDPTELGCHISSIRCQQIQCTTQVEAEERAGVYGSGTGMIVPEDALNPESSWKCLTCGEIYPVKYAASIAEKIGREAEEFQEKRGEIDAEEEFLKKYSKVLAVNHFYLLEIKVELAQLYGRTAGEPLPMMHPQRLLRKKILCEELLKVLNAIVPGFNRLRALILYEYQAAIATLSKLKHSVGEISTQKHIDDLVNCKHLITEVVQVLSWEPELSVEYRRCEGAKRELSDLEETIALLREMRDNITVPLHRPEAFGPEAAKAITNEETLRDTNEFEDDLELF